jgi:hypothetical protein
MKSEYTLTGFFDSVSFLNTAMDLQAIQNWFAGYGKSGVDQLQYHTLPEQKGITQLLKLKEEIAKGKDAAQVLADAPDTFELIALQTNANATYSKQEIISLADGKQPGADYFGKARLKIYWSFASEGLDYYHPPTAPAEKARYNQIAFGLMNDPDVLASEPPISIQWLDGFHDVEGTDWQVADGCEALDNHEVLRLYENNRGQNDYGYLSPNMDEYGYVSKIPALYQGQGRGRSIPFEITTTIEGNTVKTEVSIKPEIVVVDALGLGGMTLDDRKSFLTQVQSILDNVMPGLDARQLRYFAGFRTAKDAKAGIPSLGINSANGAVLTDEQLDKIISALNANKTLGKMLSAAEPSTDKTQGNYKISVVDAAGKALTKDEIILSSGSQSVKTTVAAIKSLDHAAVLQLLNGK